MSCTTPTHMKTAGWNITVSRVIKHTLLIVFMQHHSLNGTLPRRAENFSMDWRMYPSRYPYYCLCLFLLMVCCKLYNKNVLDGFFLSDLGKVWQKAICPNFFWQPSLGVAGLLKIRQRDKSEIYVKFKGHTHWKHNIENQVTGSTIGVYDVLGNLLFKPSSASACLLSDDI